MPCVPGRTTAPARFLPSSAFYPCLPVPTIHTYLPITTCLSHYCHSTYSMPCAFFCILTACLSHYHPSMPVPYTSYNMPLPHYAACLPPAVCHAPVATRALRTRAAATLYRLPPTASQPGSFCCRFFHHTCHRFAYCLPAQRVPPPPTTTTACYRCVLAVPAPLKQARYGGRCNMAGFWFDPLTVPPVVLHRLLVTPSLFFYRGFTNPSANHDAS